jgi:thiamine pyrophosphokinase
MSLTSRTVLDGVVLMVAGSPEGVGPDVLKRLAPQASAIVAIDAGADRLLEADICPDLLIGDLDSIGEEARTAFKVRGVETYAVSPIKDESDVALALEWAIDQGFTRAVFTHALGGRLDHTLGVLGAINRMGLPLVDLIDLSVQVRCFSAEGTPRVMLSDFGLRSGDEFSVLSLDPQARLNAQGVAYPADQLELPLLGDRGLSNIVVEESAFVEAARGRLMLIKTMPLDDRYRLPSV